MRCDPGCGTGLCSTGALRPSSLWRLPLRVWVKRPGMFALPWRRYPTKAVRADLSWMFSSAFIPAGWAEECLRQTSRVLEQDDRYCAFRWIFAPIAGGHVTWKPEGISKLEQGICEFERMNSRRTWYSYWRSAHGLLLSS